jgi:hypothetical protein
MNAAHVRAEAGISTRTRVFARFGFFPMPAAAARVIGASLGGARVIRSMRSPAKDK